MVMTEPMSVASSLAAAPPGVRLRLVALDAVDQMQARAILSADERDRAARFHFDRDRRRFVAARAALRETIADDLGMSPVDVRFELGRFGKPRLAAGMRRRFNLSHSDAYAVIALTSDAEVGVDLEHVREIEDCDRLAATVFSVRERAELEALPPADRLRGFFAGWTRKEAYIKATGDGLQQPLADFDVRLAPDRPPRLLRVKHRPAEVSRWSMWAWEPVPGYLAALCVETPATPHC